MKILSILTVLCFTLITNIANADETKTPANTMSKVTNTANTTPDVAIINIFNQSITGLLAIKNDTITEIHSVIKNILVPKINIQKSAKLILKKYWGKMDDAQKTKIKNYIINSLIKDYSTFLVGYDGFDKLELIIKETKLKGNRAKLTTDILNDKKSLDIDITFKMINEENEWKIYDLSVAGVSLMKSFKAEFKSIIRRKGFEYFITNI